MTRNPDIEEISRRTAHVEQHNSSEVRLKHLAYSSALLFAFMLSACGGGGGDGSADTKTSSATQQQQSVTSSGTSVQSGQTASQTLVSASQVIEYHGDSTIWGLKSGTQDTQVAKPAPTAFLEALPSSPKQEVRNKGVSGTTACDLLNGRPLLGIDSNWQTQMASSNATVVIINHGINDSGPAGENINDYKSCLTNLAQIAKTRGKKVIFETPNPVDREGLDTYVAAMKDVALQQNIPVIDQFANLNKSLATRTIRDMCPDGTHPSDQVYIEKGQYAASVFKTLLR